MDTFEIVCTTVSTAGAMRFEVKLTQDGKSKIFLTKKIRNLGKKSQCWTRDGEMIIIQAPTFSMKEGTQYPCKVIKKGRK